MSRSVLRTELTKDRSDKGPNWTSTSVLDSKRTEVDKDRSGKGPKWMYTIIIIIVRLARSTDVDGYRVSSKVIGLIA